MGLGGTCYLAVRTFAPAGGPQQNDLLSPHGGEVAVRRVLFPLLGK